MDFDCVTNKSMYSVLATNPDLSLGFILAMLNSRLISWYFLTRSQVGQRDDFPKIVLKELRSLPMPTASAISEHRHRLVAQLSDESLRLQDLVGARETILSPEVAQRADREIRSLNQRIDCGVYELFGLTPQDVGVVEA